MTGSLSVTDRLRAHAFFRDLPAALLEVAAAGAVERVFRTGEFLLREGRPADRLFAVVEGKVALEVYAAEPQRVTVQTVGPGEIVGWSWLAPPRRWTLDAMAVKPTLAIAVDPEGLWRRFAEEPAEGYAFVLRLLPVLAGRIHGLEQQLLEADVL